MTVAQHKNNQKLIEALRSGTYKQGRYKLRHAEEEGDTFCCLGVACDLINPQKWGEPDNIGSKPFGGHNFCTPPEPIWKTKYGWPGEAGPSIVTVIHEGDGSPLSLNDEGESFTFIADKMEEWLKTETVVKGKKK